jgi:hypothetical protein
MRCESHLSVAVPVELAGDFLSKLHYVAEGLLDCELSELRDRVYFRLRPDALLTPEIVAGRIADVARRMCEAYHPGSARVLHCRQDRPVPFGADPHAELEARGELKCFGAGRFGLGPLPLRLLNSFERRVKQLGDADLVPERRFPNLLGAETLAKCQYLRSFPHSLAMVCHLREDLEAIQEFARAVHWEHGHLAVPENTLAAPKCVLSPTICFHHYAWLENTSGCPDHTITALGKCFRYESGNLTGLERLWDFTMREIIWVGRREHVLSRRAEFIRRSCTMLDEWGLNYEIVSANDPFFIDDYSVQVMFQKAFDLKYEVVVPLPYKDKGLAVGSFNYHQDFFGRSLNIAGAGGEPVHTGCLGFGLERLVLAFLAQYGLDTAMWPASVRQEVEAPRPLAA